ncbi:sulfotransferase family protein [Chryseosolibacter indicus]|uniref:Sulfotransferase family protein n=1 Tax=Chryseosolibacter indicus TaxID=2782351 RepID=A0ABS5VPC6_9BACT|nr:sulfotransferase family protein [Chryseosolibacter indicus]
MTTINLISGPRNISTALMYSFAQRPDTNVLDEPFYSVYLFKTNVSHPGKEDVLNSLPQTETEVRSLIHASKTKSVLFIKNMAHHIEVLENPFIEECINVFLIRNPYQIIASYAEVINAPVMRDIGIEYQYNLYQLLRRSGKKTVVLDSGTLLKNPQKVLEKLCSSCAIDFDQRMLHWQPGPKSYDGVWATHWYSNVHQSSGFEKQKTSERKLPPHLEPLYEKSKRFYEKLLPISLKA